LKASGSEVTGFTGAGNGFSPGNNGCTCSGWSAFSNPGRKNEAGETLCLELIPLHPAPKAKRAAHVTKRQDFQ
jgi:hypothetical protein